MYFLFYVLVISLWFYLYSCLCVYFSMYVCYFLVGCVFSSFVISLFLSLLIEGVLYLFMYFVISFVISVSLYVCLSLCLFSCCCSLFVIYLCSYFVMSSFCFIV